MQKGIFSLFFVGCLHVITAQITFTREFTNKLLDAGAQIHISDDNWFKVSYCSDTKIVFDLCVLSEKDSAEIKYLILPETQSQRFVFPEIHFMSKVASLAINDDSHWIRTKSFSQREIETKLKADWAGELNFTPKQSFSDKKYAKAFSLYREGYGMIYAILLYNFEYKGYQEHIHSISFIDKL